MELDVGHPILLVPGEGEVIGDSDDRRVEILCDRDVLCATWTRFGPGRGGAIPTFTGTTPTSSMCSTAS